MLVCTPLGLQEYRRANMHTLHLQPVSVARPFILPEASRLSQCFWEGENNYYPEATFLPVLTDLRKWKCRVSGSCQKPFSL